MADAKDDPVSAKTPVLVNPQTGLPAPAGDMRAEFERLSKQTPCDPEELRAFLESKIELIRHDPHVSETEKKQAIEDLQRRIKELPSK
jgi:hypothetical protein